MYRKSPLPRCLMCEWLCVVPFGPYWSCTREGEEVYRGPCPRRRATSSCLANSKSLAKSAICSAHLPSPALAVATQEEFNQRFAFDVAFFVIIAASSGDQHLASSVHT